MIFDTELAIGRRTTLLFGVVIKLSRVNLMPVVYGTVYTAVQFTGRRLNGITRAQQMKSIFAHQGLGITGLTNDAHDRHEPVI